MEPKDIVAAGILLVFVSLLLALLTSVWIIPLGLFVSFVGLLLYLFKRHHERRMDSKRNQVE
ncbi:Flp pilus assembly protein TadB [Halorubrum trapanicum]|uniref:Flp pilus assembly protein TadB n=1 Tax=Halorubrum trapanicum TaxID=29284 RepID=A0A8J7RPE6_9EURY|nr:Flp pilus assembly protein TadB [Halorubrum trapanicum]